MRRSTFVRTLRVFSALLLTGSVSAPTLAGAEVIRRAAAGSEVFGAQLALSGNGRFLLRLEESGSTVCNTVRLPTGPDIVVYDLETSTAECITVNAAGAGVSGLHSSAAISADGQLVVFSSSANGLDPRCPGNNGIPHIFLRNRTTRRTECISITEAGAPGNAPSVSPVISANGNLVAFWSSASNLTPGKTDIVRELFVVRVIAGARSGAILQVARPSTADHTIALSADGRFVMFPSARPNPAGGPALISDFFRQDLSTGETIPIAVSATGVPADGFVGSPATLSADGRFATFTATATNLVPGVSSPIRQLYRRDLQTGEVLLVSRGWAGVPGNIDVPLFRVLSMSADGRFVVFSSEATNLVPNDTNARMDVYVADLTTGTSQITRLSVATDGLTEANGGSEWGASISADGGLVAFGSRATNLDPDSPGSGAFVARIPPAIGPVLTGAGLGGGPHVRSLRTAGRPDPAADFFAYDGSFDGGVTVARGDIDNDGVPDIVTGAGPGGLPIVRIFSGAQTTRDASGHIYPLELVSFYAYDPRWGGGVTVAAADVTGDGVADIITGAGPGGAPHVRVFQAPSSSAAGPLSITEYASFYAYNPAFIGGVRVAAGDLDGDGVSEILSAAGPGASPHVQAFSLNGARQPETVLSFFAYNPAFMGGVFVAAGDIDGDGREELITGADAGGGPHVRVFGTGPAFTALHEVYSFFAYEPGFTGGVRVAAGDLDGDGAAEIITAPGPWHAPVVRVFHSYANGALGQIGAFYAYDPAFSGGVFVAAPH